MQSCHHAEQLAVVRARIAQLPYGLTQVLQLRLDVG